MTNEITQADIQLYRKLLDIAETNYDRLCKGLPPIPPLQLLADHRSTPDWMPIETADTTPIVGGRSATIVGCDENGETSKTFYVTDSPKGDGWIAENHISGIVRWEPIFWVPLPDKFQDLVIEREAEIDLRPTDYELAQRAKPDPTKNPIGYGTITTSEGQLDVDALLKILLPEKKPSCNHDWRYVGSDSYGSHKGVDCYRCSKCDEYEYRVDR